MMLSALIAAVCLAQAGSSLADGAIAIGIAPGGVTKGYATGYSINEPNEEAARKAAVNLCRKSHAEGNVDEIVTSTATSRCQVVETFRNKCWSNALDPKAGTPGVGWALADTQEAADAEALKKCRNTAGPARQSFCIVGDRKCDGTAK
jgi:hypothetical protein